MPSISKNNLTSINLPDAIDHIGKHAFSENKLKGELTISARSVDTGAFYQNDLTAVKFTDNVVTIGMVFCI